MICTPENPLIHLLFEIVDAFMDEDVVATFEFVHVIVPDFVLNNKREVMEEIEMELVELLEVAILEEFVKDGNVT